LSFQTQILDWYDKNRRSLPWRADCGQAANPYHVWLSEIMLQQTTVATVKGYFDKFLQNWPDVNALANAELDEVLSAWAGLGYYARARNLHKCARMVADDHGGQFPTSPSELKKLPGIGPYTSGAIAAIAFDQPFAAVDGNVERVLSRYYAIETPLPRSKPAIKEKADGLVPGKRAGDFAQAMMDLGATICNPRAPLCARCPLAGECLGLEKNIAGELPKKLAKKTRPVRTGKAFVVQREDGAILLRRRPAKGLLAGMLEVPSTQWREIAAQKAPRDGPLVEHTFSHFHLVLEVENSNSISQAEPREEDSHEWLAPGQLSNSALPTVMKKILARALGPDVLKS
jgi:A/G-specific adenine glycosylase